MYASRMLRIVHPVLDSCKMIRLLRRRDISVCLLDCSCLLYRLTAEGHGILIPVVHDDPIITLCCFAILIGPAQFL